MFAQLVALSRRYRPGGRGLTLGRQWFLYRDIDRRNWLGQRRENRYQAALDRHQMALRAADLVQSDGFAEKMLEALGFGTFESVDRSDYEGATRVWDMNRAVPADWHDTFDTIFDGGTVEHIFNVPMVFENVHAMLKVGGRYISATPLNGWPGHGIYQFGPEIVWSYWHRVKKCKVHACAILSLDGTFALNVPDPALSGKRSEWGLGRNRPDSIPAGKTYLWYQIEKTGETALDAWPQQSDYQTQWAAHAQSTPAVA